MNEIRTKRIYRAARRSDGRRILVDRVWPRGMTKHRARLDDWVRDAAPGSALRKAFHEGHIGWEEFRERYIRELDGAPREVLSALQPSGAGPVTLLYASRDEEHNNAVVLAEYLRRDGCRNS